MKEASDRNSTFNIYLLHGFTGSGLDFSLLKTSIQSVLSSTLEELNWLCPSLPGHGESSAMDCSIQGQYDFLNHYIETNIRQGKLSDSSNEQKNILIAYSMGSRLGLYHATQQTDFWDAIVLIGVNPGIQSDSERALRRESDIKLSESIERNGLPWFLDYWNNLPLIRTQSKASKNFQEAMQKRKQSLDIKGLQNSLVYFGQGTFPDLWDLIPLIRSPFLLINGNLDVKYCEISQKISEIHSEAHCEVIENCGHAPHIESPLATAEAIVAFLKKYLL